MKHLALLIALSLCATVSAQQLTPRQIEILGRLADAIDAMTAPAPDPVTRITDAAQLQPALDAARPSDVIELAPGIYVGNFILGPKDAPGVTVRLDADATLMSPSNAPVLQTAPGGSYWRIEGGIMRAANPAGTVVRLGSGRQLLEEIPHHITLVGVKVLGDPVQGGKRGIELNGAHLSILGPGCEVRDFKVVGQDTQAIAGWNGPGPFVINDCLLEAAGENVMFGGADPSIAGLIPSDITFTNNVVQKPMAWRGTNWTVKNLFELKSAQRVIVRGNVFENNWLHAQNGYGIVLKSTNQDGACPWCETRDVLFEGNRILNVSAGFSLAGRPEAHPAVAMSHVTIRDNLIVTNSQELRGDGRCLTIQGVHDVTFEHNTCSTDGASSIVFGEVAPNERFVLRGNIIADRCAGDCWGIKGSGAAEGLASLLKWAPGHVYEGNLIVTPQPHLYGPPTQNRIETVMPADTTGYGVRR